MVKQHLYSPQSYLCQSTTSSTTTSKSINILSWAIHISKGGGFLLLLILFCVNNSIRLDSFIPFCLARPFTTTTTTTGVTSLRLVGAVAAAAADAASSSTKRWKNNRIFQFQSSSLLLDNQKRSVITSFVTTTPPSRNGGGSKLNPPTFKFSRYFPPTSSFSHIAMSSSSTSLSSFQSTTTTWSEFQNIHSSNYQEIISKHVIPPLSSSSHKGSSGRVGVLGGSERYTGAPYYAAMASLKVGADLAFVFCAEEAAIPIKCYSPELMVAPVYSAAQFEKAQKESGKYNDEEIDRLINEMVQKVTSLFDRMHVLIIGPGLGRDPLVLRATCQIIQAARLKNIKLVLDADALFLLTMKENQEILKGYEGVVLTPNVMEYRRLEQAFLGENIEQQCESKEEEEKSNALKEALEGTIVVKKGHHDTITTISSSDKESSMVCEEVGGLKRSGGIGDVLAGTLGAFVAWNHILSNSNNKEEEKENTNNWMILSCWSACCVVKKATKSAFDKKKRAMTAPDVLEEIGSVVDEMT